MKRVYEPAEKDDGYRVLIDRVWPRGIRKSDLKFDEWMKDLAPSTELRQSFGHDPAKWKEFQLKYQLELRNKEARQKIEALAKRALHRTVTLIYSAHDTEHNNAVVLKALLDREMKKWELLSKKASSQRGGQKGSQSGGKAA